MKISNIELIYKIYENSRHKKLIKEFFPNRIYSLTIKILIFGTLMMYFNFKNQSLHVLITMGLYIYFISNELNSVNKNINKKINDKKDLRFESFRSDNLYLIFGLTKSFFIRYSSEYAEIIYFQFLLANSKLTESEIDKCFEYIKYKTKNYMKITERSSFNAMISVFISLFISLSVWYFDKKVVLKDLNLIQFGFYFFIVIILIIPILMFLYGFFSFLQSKDSKDKEIKDMLELYKNINRLKDKS